MDEICGVIKASCFEYALVLLHKNGEIGTHDLMVGEQFSRYYEFAICYADGEDCFVKFFSEDKSWGEFWPQKRPLRKNFTKQVFDLFPPMENSAKLCHIALLCTR